MILKRNKNCLFSFQVKIWFQNRRTKWKKQENISNAEAAELMKAKKVTVVDNNCSPKPQQLSKPSIDQQLTSAAAAAEVANQVSRLYSAAESLGLKLSGTLVKSEVIANGDGHHLGQRVIENMGLSGTMNDSDVGNQSCLESHHLNSSGEEDEMKVTSRDEEDEEEKQLVIEEEEEGDKNNKHSQ